MAIKSKRGEKRERQKVSAKRRMDEHKVGNNPSISLPSNVKQFNVKSAGSKRLDIIPYEVSKGNPFADPGELYFERTFYVHRGIGPSNETYTCLQKTYKEPCPVCEYRQKLIDDSYDENEEMIKELAPKERQLWNVFDQKDPESGVQVWEVSWWMFGKKLDSLIRNDDDDEGYAMFSDPDEGFTLKVTFVEESFNKKDYIKPETIEFKKRTEPLDDDLLEKAVCLDDCIVKTPYEKLKEIFLQISDNSGKEDDDEKPKKKGKDTKSEKVKAKAKVKEEEEDDEEDDEEEVKPKAKKGKKVEEKTAEECGIEKNDDVMFKGKQWSVVKISGDGTSLTLEDEDGNVKKAVGPEEVQLVDADTFEEEEEEEEEKPKPKKGKKVEAEEEEEDDEEEGDDDDEDDEEDENEDDEEEDDAKEEKKVTPKGKKKPKDEDEDDDLDLWGDDDDEEEEEEEEKPKPKKKGKK